MAKAKYVKDQTTGEPIFAVSHTKAIYDSNGCLLDDKLIDLDNKAIKSIIGITNNADSGAANTIRITFADNTTQDFTIYNGGQGSSGIRGSQWFSGTAMSGTSTTTNYYSYSGASNVLVGDYYLNTSYGYVYRCTTAGNGSSAKWTYQGSIRGASGSNASVTIDTALSTTSANPVQNSVITAKLNELESSGGSYDGPSWNWLEYDKLWEMDASNSGLLVKSIDTWNGAFLGHPDGSGIRAGIDGNYIPESMTGHPMNIFVQADEPANMSEGDIWLQTT